jgi:polyribonucleotide nucleotidyltransferase
MYGSLEVGKDNLRRIIGPQGSVIKGLEADSNSRLSIDDAGLVHIYSPAQEQYRKAVSAIEGITGASLRVRPLSLGFCSDMLFATSTSAASISNRVNAEVQWLKAYM